MMMWYPKRPIAVVIFLGSAYGTCQRTSAGVSEKIRMVMQRSQADWNAGNMDSFAKIYKNSPSIILIGPANAYGFDAMRESYAKHYGTPDTRGILTYSQLEVQPLDKRFATATGHFHLERSATGGGKQDGYFMVLFENTTGGWKIVRDASVVTSPQK